MCGVVDKMKSPYFLYTIKIFRTSSNFKNNATPITLSIPTPAGGIKFSTTAVF
jgi:hypothetical protein